MKILQHRDVLSIVLAGGMGERLYPLTRDRAKPAVPFGGRYRIVDFVLNNFVNSGLMKIKVDGPAAPDLLDVRTTAEADLRDEFADTALWRGSIVTDAEGFAQVSAALPDNLTTWRMDARAVTLDTRAGSATQDLISSRPLLVRPQTPRFFVAGDQAVLGAAVHNNTGETHHPQTAMCSYPEVS